MDFHVSLLLNGNSTSIHPFEMSLYPSICCHSFNLLLCLLSSQYSRRNIEVAKLTTRCQSQPTYQPGWPGSHQGLQGRAPAKSLFMTPNSLKKSNHCVHPIWNVFMLISQSNCSCLAQNTQFGFDYTTCAKANCIICMQWSRGAPGGIKS